MIEVDPANSRYPSQLIVPLTVIVNQQIMAHSDEVEEGWEGCLSVLDLRGRVLRWRWLKVSGLDRKGNPIEINAEGFFARVIQHEVDHLDGHVFLDRVADLTTLTHLREYEKYWLNRG